MGDPLFHEVQDNGDEADYTAIVVPGLVTAEVVHHIMRVPTGQEGRENCEPCCGDWLAASRPDAQAVSPPGPAQEVRARGPR